MFFVLFLLFFGFYSFNCFVGNSIDKKRNNKIKLLPFLPKDLQPNFIEFLNTNDKIKLKEINKHLNENLVIFNSQTEFNDYWKESIELGNIDRIKAVLNLKEGYLLNMNYFQSSTRRNLLDLAIDALDYDLFIRVIRNVNFTTSVNYYRKAIFEPTKILLTNNQFLIVDDLITRGFITSKIAISNSMSYFNHLLCFYIFETKNLTKLAKEILLKEAFNLYPENTIQKKSQFLMIKSLIEIQNVDLEDIKNQLFSVVLKLNVELLEYILTKFKIDINQKIRNRTILSFLVNFMDDSKFLSLNDKSGMLEWLLKNGADVTLVDDSGQNMFQKIKEKLNRKNQGKIIQIITNELLKLNDKRSLKKMLIMRLKCEGFDYIKNCKDICKETFEDNWEGYLEIDIWLVISRLENIVSKKRIKN